MTGHSKPSRKPKDKAKEAAVKSKGQSQKIPLVKAKKSKKDPSLFESADFCPLAFSAASLALSLGLRPSLLWSAICCKTSLHSNCWIRFGSRMFSFCYGAQPASLIILVLNRGHSQTTLTIFCLSLITYLCLVDSLHYCISTT